MSVATRKVLVTGGTSGLGLAMATALAQAGATVALTGRSGARAAAVAAELPGAVGLELDVREESSVTRAVAAAWSRLGGIDVLVNNAGIGMRTVNPRCSTGKAGYAMRMADDRARRTAGRRRVIQRTPRAKAG